MDGDSVCETADMEKKSARIKEATKSKDADSSPSAMASVGNRGRSEFEDAKSHEQKAKKELVDKVNKSIGEVKKTI